MSTDKKVNPLNGNPEPVAKNPGKLHPNVADKYEMVNGFPAGLIYFRGQNYDLSSIEDPSTIEKLITDGCTCIRKKQ